MRTLGKWLVLIGFGVPLCVSVWTYSRGYARATAGIPPDKAVPQAAIDRDMRLTIAMLPVGMIGIPLWLIGASKRRNP